MLVTAKSCLSAPRYDTCPIPVNLPHGLANPGDGDYHGAMVHVPTATARWMVYWSAVAGLMLVALALSTLVRRSHVFDPYIIREARRQRLSPALVSAVIWRESKYDPQARGEAGEIGLMQVTPAAAADWSAQQQADDFEPDQLWDPRVNITVGTWYLARAVRYWDSRNCKDPIPFALAEYNAGRRNARRWADQAGTDARAFVDAIQFDTTRRYVEEILQRSRGGV